MPSSNKNLDYEAFTKAFVLAYPELQKQMSWKKAKAMWTEVKPVKGNRDKLNQIMSELKEKAQNKKLKKMSFWVNLKEKSESAPKVDNSETQEQASQDVEMENTAKIDEDVKETENSNRFAKNSA